MYGGVLWLLHEHQDPHPPPRTLSCSYNQCHSLLRPKNFITPIFCVTSLCVPPPASPRSSVLVFVRVTFLFLCGTFHHVLLQTARDLAVSHAGSNDGHWFPSTEPRSCSMIGVKHSPTDDGLSYSLLQEVALLTSHRQC